MIRKTLTTGLALAALATTSLALSRPADARTHRMTTTRMHLVPAQPKPTFVATPYGGPMMLVDVQHLAPGTGALGLGLLPSTGLFKDVPLINGFGL